MFGPLTETETPGSTAPELSFTVPVIVPVVRCAWAGAASASESNARLAAWRVVLIGSLPVRASKALIGRAISGPEGSRRHVACQRSSSVVVWPPPSTRDAHSAPDRHGHRLGRRGRADP